MWKDLGGCERIKMGKNGAKPVLALNPYGSSLPNVSEEKEITMFYMGVCGKLNLSLKRFVRSRIVYSTARLYYSIARLCEIY